MRIFISAGEPSGDVHGANFIRAFQCMYPGAEFVGFGGDRMKAAGCRLLYPLCQLAVMWFLRVLANLHLFLDVLSKADRWFKHRRPDAVVLIDYPGLHWWLARRAHFHGIPVFYFVPPQLWAWASWRVVKMQRWVDHVLCSLPFEESWYGERGVPAHYVGHPFFDEFGRQPTSEYGRRLADVQDGTGNPIIGLLPGSRAQEVGQNFPTMLRVALRLHRQIPHVRFAVACFKEEHRQLVLKSLRGHDLPISPHVGKTPEIIHSSDVCLAVSGSVGLELLYQLKPAVVLYKTSTVGLRLSRRFMSAKYISLVNLLADRELYPEFLTDRCESQAIAEQLLKWLTDATCREKLCTELAELRARVGQPGASERAARYVLEALTKPGKLQHAA